MRMRFVCYFIATALLWMGNSFADSECVGQLGETGHGCSAGQYWNSTLSECAVCPSGRYCPRQSDQNNGVAYCCPPPFTATETTGATSWTNCRIKVTECEDGHTLSTPRYIECPQWNNTHTACTTVGVSVPTYEVQRNPNESGHPKIALEWTYFLRISGYSYAMYDVPPENGYHWETHLIYSPYQTGMDHWNNWLSTGFNIVCVPNKITCETFRNFPDDSTQAVGAPIETTHFGNNSYDTIGTYCPNDATFPYDPDNVFAQWVPGDEYEPGHWDVSRCRCEMTSVLDGANCYGYGYKNADVTTGDPYTVHSIYENVIYQDDLNNASYCTRCLEDTDSIKYFVEYGYDSTEHKVAFCNSTYEAAQFRKKGRYLRHSCSTAWENPTSLTSNPCPRVACTAVGTTTNELLPIQNNTPIEQICVYGSETRICDTDGETCIPLQDVGSLPLSGWEMLP